MVLRNDVENKIREQLSAARMASDVKVIIENSPRHAGTENEWKAAKYIEQEFLKSRLEVRVDKVPGVNKWTHHKTHVKVVEPVERELYGVAILGSGATPPEGITAEVVYAGRGRTEDYEVLDVAGKFVFRDPPRALTLDNASDETAPQGPTEMLIDRKVAGFIEHSRLKGNILQTDLLSGPEGLSVPAVALTYEDGQVIKELLREWYALPGWFKRTEEHIPVKLNIVVEAESEPSYGLNVIASIPGSEKPNEKIVLVAHHDNAFGPGACDNATADAINIECARVLSKMPAPKRTIAICVGDRRRIRRVWLKCIC